MTSASDLTFLIRKKAVAFPDVATGSSHNQSSFKAGRGAFLYIGPGAKGQGFKAMFKLRRSMAHVRKLAAKTPERFEVGSTGWVTTRLTAEEPLPRSIWEAWLEGPYELTGASKASKK